MSFKYIQDYYRVPAKRGQRVRNLINNRIGVITSAPGQYIRIRWEGDLKPMGPYHPTNEIEYLESPK